MMRLLVSPLDVVVVVAVVVVVVVVVVEVVAGSIHTTARRPGPFELI